MNNITPIKFIIEYYLNFKKYFKKYKLDDIQNIILSYITYTQCNICYNFLFIEIKNDYNNKEWVIEHKNIIKCIWCQFSGICFCNFYQCKKCNDIYCNYCKGSYLTSLICELCRKKICVHHNKLYKCKICKKLLCSDCRRHAIKNLKCYCYKCYNKF